MNPTAMKSITIHKIVIFSHVLALLGCTSPADQKTSDTSANPDKPSGESLFDGKTFQGWEGDTVNFFRIEEGAIVGGNLEKDIPHNAFLCVQQMYDNFVLTLQFKLLGENTNAGIQFRSVRIPDHFEMIGYQADLGQQYWGCLYDESRRKKVLTGPDSTTIAKALKRNDWNTYEIRAEDKQIQLFINGTQTVDYTEPLDTIPQTGLIGLQIHGGGPGEVWYKDIEITELP
jgi:hypothetical protein